jgi:transposase
MSAIKIDEYQMFHDLAQEQEITLGRVNISALSRSTGYNRKTIRKYLSAPPSSLKRHRRLRGSKLDPYKEYLRERISKFPSFSSVRLLQEIQNQGYTGKYSLLKDYIRTIRPKMAPLRENE